MATKKPINKLKKMETRTLTTQKTVSKLGREEPGFLVRAWKVLTRQDPPTRRRRAAKKAAATRRKRSSR